MENKDTNVRKDSFIINGFLELAITCGGISILLYPVFYLTTGFALKEPYIGWAVALSFAVNYPHFAATLYRLYHNKVNRTAYPFTTYYFPWLALLAFSVALCFPQSFGGYYSKFFLYWSGYHYSGQTFGITLIYARRNGIQVSRVFRTLLMAAIYSTYLFPIIRNETYGTATPYFDILMPSLHLPAWTAEIAWHFLVFSWAAFFTYIILFPRYQSVKRPPLSIMLPAIAQFVWYIPGAYSPNFYYFVPLFHGFQYLLIAWIFQFREVKEDYLKTNKVFSWQALLLENTKYFLILMVLGAALFRFIPDALALTGLPIRIVEPLWIATVQIHHFWIDGVVWRLRQPHVGKKLLASSQFDPAARPSMGNASPSSYAI